MAPLLRFGFGRLRHRRIIQKILGQMPSRNIPSARRVLTRTLVDALFRVKKIWILHWNLGPPNWFVQYVRVPACRKRRCCGVCLLSVYHTARLFPTYPPLFRRTAWSASRRTSSEAALSSFARTSRPRRGRMRTSLRRRSRHARAGRGGRAEHPQAAGRHL